MATVGLSSCAGAVPGCFIETIGPGPGSYQNPDFCTFWPRTGADYT